MWSSNKVYAKRRANRRELPRRSRNNTSIEHHGMHGAGNSLTLFQTGIYNAVMEPNRTTQAVQNYLDALRNLPGDAPVGPIVRALLTRSAQRLQQLCRALLYRSYPRLTRAPLNLDTDEMLGAVVERLIKALREARPTTVKQFFSLANQHLRWELNDLARRLDQQEQLLAVPEDVAWEPSSEDSPLSVNAQRLLSAIEDLPEDLRETFSLVRMQGFSHVEAAEVLGVSIKTVQRRLSRTLIVLEEQLVDLQPKE